MAFTEIVKKAAAKSGTTQAQAKLLASALFELISESLKEGQNVRVPDFGSFAPKKVDARSGRNPRTGETIKIPAKTKARFSSGKALNDTLNPVKKASVSAKKVAAPAKKSAKK